MTDIAATRGAMAEPDRIVTWLREYAAIRFGENGDFDLGGRLALKEAADALARDQHHRETNDIREGGFLHNESTKND